MLISVEDQIRLIEIAHESQDYEIRTAAKTLLRSCGLIPVAMTMPGNDGRHTCSISPER